MNYPSTGLIPAASPTSTTRSSTASSLLTHWLKAVASGVGSILFTSSTCQGYEVVGELVTSNG